MSSVSSHDGSEKDVLFHRMPDGLTPRYTAMRKTDLLDTLDAVRHRDTDTWSVAATIDDQESVISGPGGTASLISSSRATAEGKETDDDRSTLDGITDGNNNSSGSMRDGMAPALLPDVTSLRQLRDMDGPHDTSSFTTDDDKRSRSNAAEFGDDGTRSAAADFDDHSEPSRDDDDGSSTHNVVSDDISAPPQPQPSFASVTKSYAELMEENEMLQTQLRNLQIAQKHQAEVIENLRSLTGCNEEVYGRALHLSQVTPEDLQRWNSQSNSKVVVPPAAAAATTATTTTPSSTSSSLPNYSTSPANTMPLPPPPAYTLPGLGRPYFDYEVNARTLTQQLARLAELVIRFVQESVVDASLQISLEQYLFEQITEFFFESLPFGTENQQLLNLAYADQIRRFHSTLGSNFAKWYRRQTVQSLSLNPASKEYLEIMRSQLTERLLDMLATFEQSATDEGASAPPPPEIKHRSLWDEILDLCTSLSLAIHAGDADVMIQNPGIGTKYDEDIMAVIGDVHADKDKRVKLVVSPLFVDEEETVLLPARVLLE